MNSNGIQWVRPPKSLMAGIEHYGMRVMVGVVAVANYVGMKMQNEARQKASWEDRTGAARSGLFYAVDTPGLWQIIGELGPKAVEALAAKTDTVVVQGEPNAINLYLGHTVFYGRYLESSNGGKNAIILSTMRANLSVLETQLKRMLR